MIVPSSQQGENIIKLMAAEVKIVTSTGKNIGEMVRKQRARKQDLDSIVTKISISAVLCDKRCKSYFDELGRGLVSMIKEHRNDLRNIGRLCTAISIMGMRPDIRPSGTMPNRHAPM